LTYAGSKILIDPVFSEKEQYPPIPLTPNRRRNPLVDLSTPLERLLDADMVLSTHTHGDHFDDRARELLDKKIELICQPEDVKTLGSTGFLNITPVDESITIRNIRITRVKAHHGTGVTGEMMGPSSGYILSSKNEPTLYITGDTVFHESISKTIEKFHPDILIINAGSPKFLNSSHIVMNIIDVEETLRIDPSLTFIIVHLDTFNHCIETREDLQEYFTPARLAEIGVKKIFIPEDNELLEFS
jgi:L-ascorbate metabolism protein UlaG (beta-lactamase superfamily)